MRMKLNSVRTLSAAVAVVALSALVLVPSASAHTGEYARFNYCPSTNPTAFKCLYSETIGGKVVLGKKTVPIVNPVTLQGGTGIPVKRFSKFYGATNGVTLSKSPQPVPGGLAGLVNCKEISNFLVRLGCESVFENGLTGVNSTLELAKPASDIRFSELNLLFAKGTALELPVKVHLENPLLGPNCYIGSATSPIILNLTTGTTAPPPPNEPISGSVGEGEFLGEEGEIAKINNLKIVDNAWSAPGATGCGGPIVELLINPIINASTGVPSPAGANTAIQVGTSYVALAADVNAH